MTLDRVILHTVVHHSSTSTNTPNVIKETFCGRTYVRMDGRTFETGFIRSTLSKSRPNYGYYGTVPFLWKLFSGQKRTMLCQ